MAATLWLRQFDRALELAWHWYFDRLGQSLRERRRISDVTTTSVRSLR